MRKFLLLCLFVIGLSFALFNFKGLASQGKYESIVLDFREDIPATEIAAGVSAIAQKYNITPQLNSEFSAKDNVYIIKGDSETLKSLRKSKLAKATEFIEPNYIYGIPNAPGYAKQWNLRSINSESASDEIKGSGDITINAKSLSVKNGADITIDTKSLLVKNESLAVSSEPNSIYPALEVPNDPYYAKQWNLRSINIESAWNETKGSGVTVAVIDTGISRVPDLEKTQFVEGYDFVNDRVDAEDDNGHGTHVAGTVAQSTNNNYGVAGVAYEANLMPLKVLDDFGGGTISDIAEAIKFAADKGADVINMSLGGGGESQLMQEAINYAHQKGVVIIAAAGNSNDNSASYPARYPQVISVAAIDSAGEKAPYSNFGAGVDISAPGGSDSGKILQETIDPETKQPIFAGFQGTSMAAPHVAGVAALIKAAGVKEPNEILSVLQKSARVIQDDALNHFGAGQLDAAAAVKLAMRGQISFKDFFRWLRDNGYLNPRFWFDGGAVALLPKIGMVVGSYLLAWFLRVYWPFSWSWSLSSGLIAGSSGLFFLKGFYIFDLPQWPFRLLGSSIPELGNAINGDNTMNPLFASVLIPFVLIVLLLGNPSWKKFAVGSTLGVASCLLVSAFVTPDIWWLGQGALARFFLIGNALLCYGIAWLAMKGEGKPA